MRAPIKRIGAWIGGVLVALVLLLLIASKIVHASWNDERAGRSISAWASSNIEGVGGPARQAFTFGRVHYPWLGALRSVLGGAPVRIDVWDVGIWDPAGGEVLHTTHLQTGLRLGSLVWHLVLGALPGAHGDLELHFVEPHLDDVRCWIEPFANGRANIVAAFSPRIQKPEVGDGMVITVERATISDGYLAMRFPRWAARIARFEMSASTLRYSSFASEQSPEAPAFVYQVEKVDAPTGHVQVGSQSLPLEHFLVTDFHAVEPRRQDMTLHAVLRSLGSELHTDGVLKDLYGPHRAVAMTLSARRVGRVLSTLPSEQYLRGDASVTAKLSGTFKHLVVEGAGHGFVLHVGSVTATEASVRYRFTDGKLHLLDCEANALDGHLRGEGELDFKDKAWSVLVQSFGIHPMHDRKLIPVTILGYVAAAFPRLLLALKLKKEVKKTVHVGNAEITLFLEPHEALPTHARASGPL